MHNFCWSIFIICLGALGACKPRIYSFRPTPATSTGRDSVRLDWKVRGKASVLFSQRRIAQPPNDSVDILEFKLIAHKGKIDSFRTILVPVMGDLSRDMVVFPVASLTGDTVIAGGVKDAVRWNGYGIGRVSGMAGRVSVVIHAGITGVLKDTVGSGAWNGTPYPGYWEIRAVLSEKEKKDHAIIPDRLMLNVIIQSFK